MIMAASRSLMLALALMGTLAVALMAWRMVEAPPDSSVGRLLVRPPTQTATAPSAPAKPQTQPELQRPVPPNLSFGWRLLPNGDLLIAGTTAPHAEVSLKRAESLLAEVRAQSSGDFVLLPPSLQPGDNDMVLIARSPTGEVRERVLIALPSPPEPIAAAKPAEQAAQIAPAPAAPQPPEAEVAIRSAEAGQRSAFQAAGSAPAGAAVRLYLNDSFVADATASPEGAWSLRVERGMAPGHYELRADVLDKDGKVLARAAVPFDYPEGPAGAEGDVQVSHAPPIAQPAPAKPGEAVVPQIQSVRVVKGDSLWRISQRVLGDGQRYIQIYQANAGQIRNPNLIYPGQVLVTPQDKAP
jgi:nucleoid-associated protein YgaU